MLDAKLVDPFSQQSVLRSTACKTFHKGQDTRQLKNHVSNKMLYFIKLGTAASILETPIGQNLSGQM